jgi:hypothetical protein
LQIKLLSATISRRAGRLDNDGTRRGMGENGEPGKGWRATLDKPGKTA